MNKKRHTPEIRPKRPKLIANTSDYIRLGLILTLALAVLPALATVTPYSWIRAGEAGNSPFLDSSGLNHPFNAAFSSAAGGDPAVVFSTTVTAGGPLGPAQITSTRSTRWGFYNYGNSGMRVQGQGGNGTVPGCDLFCLPPTNWVMECWVLPQHDGHSGGSLADDGTTAQFMSTGSGQFGGTSRGVAFRTRYDLGSDTVAISCWSIGPLAVNNFQLGDAVISDKTKFIHIAAVNDNGVLTFYTNGVSAGSTNSNITAPSPSTPYIGSGQDTGAPFDGYLDECRYSTFDPGAFVVSDLLLRPPGPSIVSNPQSTTAWAGGTAPFLISIAYDTTATYQWRRGGVNIGGATSSQYILEPATVGDTGATFDCVITASSISKTSTVATLTVIANDPAEVAAYRNLVQAEPSLVAYFPVDTNTGDTLVNVKDNTHNGLLEMDAYFDGRTNNAFGQRALSFLGNGDVQIPNNAAFEFPSGNGTIEFVVYLDPAAGDPPTDQTLVSEATDASIDNYYFIRAARFGGSLIYGNSGGDNLSWVVSGGMTGKRTHVALVFDNFTNVTAYANGLNLGTLVQTNFGPGLGSPLWIGSMGTSSTRYWLYGSLDELSIYSAALPQNTIQVHYSGYFFGTHTAPASFVSQSPSKTLLAGASPVLRGTATGTLPIIYQWQKDGTDIPGATKGTLELSNVTTTATFTLVATNNYGSPATSAPIVLTMVAPPAGYATRVMAASPRAYWRLSESSGSVTVDSAGFNDGAYQGGYTLGYPPFQGESGTAVLLNGSSGRAIVPNSPDINPNGPFSIELWAKFVGGNGGNQVALSSLDRPSRGAGYEYYHGGNYNGWEFHTGGGGNYDAIAGDSQKEPVGEWWHVVGTYDGTQIDLFVNGQLNNTQDGQDVTAPPFTPNTVANLFIGSRSDNGNFFNGAIADVAFYNYVLTRAQISNHWSSIWTAAAITLQPIPTNSTELSTVTLTAAASGLPNGYQWYKDNVALSATATNFEGSLHFPGGVTSPTLTIAKLTTADNGQYHMVVINPVAGAQTVDVTVSATPDTTPPNIVSAGSMDGATVDICFDEYLDAGGFDPGADPGTARNPANYTFVSPAGNVTSAELRLNGKAVRLTVTGLASTPGTPFTIKVAGVRDWSRRVGNAIPPAGQTVSGAVQSMFTTVVDILNDNTFLTGTTYSCGPNEFEAEAGGADIWDAADNFHYAYKESNGDFDVRVQIAAENTALPGNRNGIMLRESTDPQSRFAYVTWNPGNIVGYHVRETLGITPIWANPPFNNWASLGPPPNVWLRLQRQGTTTAAFVSTDGFLWSAFGTTTQDFGSTALLGLASNNGGNKTIPGFTQYANYSSVSTLHLVKVGAVWTLSWTGPGVLQSSSVSVTGPYSTAASQVNPQPVSPTGTQMFFRLKQ